MTILQAVVGWDRWIVVDWKGRFCQKIRTKDKEQREKVDR
jgi:hypothetical protein